MDALSSKQREESKSPKEKLADITYVVSHAAVCLLTDFTSLISNHHQQQIDPSFKGNIWSHLSGEIAGDILAVPVTIALQRITPECTSWMRDMLEPLVRPLYWASAQQEAQAWAKEHEVTLLSDAYKQRILSQYEHEIGKMPMGIIWSVASLGLNALCQKCFLGNSSNIATIVQANAMGALSTFAITNGLRLLSPHAMRTFDHAVYEHIAEPTTHIVDAILHNERMAEPSFIAL
jgi:hypothetical protein